MKLVSIPANPVPDNAVAGSIKTPDGVTLRFARFAPPAGRKGTVVVLQGRAEYIEKYFETVRDLRARGFAVATFDWRGQGLSDRALSDRHKGYVRNFSEYATDLDAIMEQVVLPDCPPPIFALGHSMGAAIGIRACHERQPLVRSRGAVGADDRAAGRAASPPWRGRSRASCGCSGAAAPMCRPATASRAAPRISSAMCSPPIRCALRATPRCWRKRPSSASARRPSPGPMPRCGR